MSIRSAADLNQNTLVGQYVYAYMQTQQYRFDPLDLKAAQLENKQRFFTMLNGRLNTLLTAMDRFGTYKDVKIEGTEETKRQFVKVSDIDSKFVTRKVTASNTDFVTATARGTALTGMNSVRVQQLATADTYIGKQVGITEDALSQELQDKLVNGQGTVSFSIKVGNATHSYNVEYSENDTNEDLMKRIVQTVNQGRSIDSSGLGDMINAAFVKDTTGTARLTFTSKATGEENQIVFSGASEEASIFGIVDTEIAANGSRKSYNENAADNYGYQREFASSLDSIINLNGVKITRGSNSISDAIDGVTLTLRKAHTDSDIATNLTTEIDTKAVENLISPLIEAFNGLANFVAVNKKAHGSDPAMIGLQNALRNMVSEDLSGYADKEHIYIDSESAPIKYLAELGFRMSSDNVLTLSDPSKLENILKNPDGPKLIADIINGFSARVSEYVDSLTARDREQGLIKSRLSSINQQITTNNKKIEQVDMRILKEADAIRKQYTAYLSAFYNAQNQSSFLSLFQGGDSLLQQQVNMQNNQNNQNR